MSENGEDFFAGKRPWSIIKDQTLQKYMTPYLAKVNRLGRSILLIDAYAGPGIFDDGELGSPCIMCEAAETYAKVGYQAFFVNNDEKYQKKLEAVLQQKGWSHSAHALLEDSYKLLQRLPSLLRDNTVFLYLDPFGLKGCEFALLEPFLRRDARYSTEILLTMNMPVVHRLAARTKEVVDKGRLQSNRERLTKVFGGDYWKDILSQPSVRAEDKEKQLIEAYLGKLQHYLPFTGSCPVREQRGSRIKYFIVFASRSPDAMLLLNDIMVNAYFSRMHQADFGGGLFQNFSWREMPPAVNTEPRESLEGCVAKKKLICYSGEKRAKEVSSMSNQSLNPFKWRHFQADSILLCVRWYLRSSLSYRDLEEMMLERGLHVDHTTIYRWVQRYAPELERRCRPHLNACNDSWMGG